MARPGNSSAVSGAVPVRVQLKRTRGWRMPPNTVKVDRTTPWGNPWKADAHLCQADAVHFFREFVTEPDWEDPEMKAVQRHLKDGLPQLRGKNLACWCALDAPCHADVLLELANPRPTGRC